MAAKKATKKATTAKKTTTAKTATAKKATAKKAPAAKRKPNAAFMAALKPSAVLANIIGDKPVPRTEVVKKLWDYIKKNKLQDTKNKRNIHADEKLKPLFGGKNLVTMFDLAKFISKHLS